jgi:hypothetical protein
MDKHITEVIQGQPYHIKLIKGQKDAYGWEITVYGTDTDAIIRKLKETHEKMMEIFPTEVRK